MALINLIAVGKLKERWFRDACDEYIKRLGPYGGVELIELPEQRLPARPSQQEIASALAKEAEAVRARIPKGAYLCALCVEGEQLTSEELSRRLARLRAGGYGKFCFLTGSSYGLDASLKEEAALRLSMSRMTFPHHLARVMLLEQLYRAAKIEEGSGYHK